MKKHVTLMIFAMLLASLFLIECSKRSHVIVSYGKYIPATDEDGERVGLPMYAVKKRKNLDDFKNLSGWKALEENNVADSNAYFAKEDEGLVIHNKLDKYRHKDTLSYTKEYNVNIRDFNFISLRYWVTLDGQFSILANIDGEVIPLLRYVKGDNKWHTYSKEIYGQTLRSITVSVSEEEANVGEFLLQYGLKAIVESITLELRELEEGVSGDKIELLADGGFEEYSLGLKSGKDAFEKKWWINAWGGNKLKTEIVDTQPYAGTQCLKLTPVNKGSSYVNFAWRGNTIGFQEGKQYEISGRVRGDDTTGLRIRCQVADGSWKTYGATSKSVTPGARWRQFKHIIDLRPFADEGGVDSGATLLLMISGTGELYLDDLSVSPIEEEKNEIVLANYFYNGSFEVGFTGWDYFMKPWNPGATAAVEYVRTHRDVLERWRYGPQVVDGGKLGEKCVMYECPYVDLPPETFNRWHIQLRSMPTDLLKNKQKVTVSFWAKLEGVPDNVNSVNYSLRPFGSGKEFPLHGDKKLTQEWKKFVLTGETPKLGTTKFHQFFQVLPISNVPGGARLYIDGFQLEYGETATEYKEREPLTVGFEYPDADTVDRSLYEKGANAKVIVNAVSEKKVDVPYKIVNMYGETAREGEISFEKGRTSQAFRLYTGRAGGYKLVIFADKKKKRRTMEFIYSVMPRFAEKKLDPDSGYGFHVASEFGNKWVLTMAQRLGVKWHRAFEFQYSKRSPKEGEYVHPYAIKSYRDFGICVMGVIFGSAEWMTTRKEGSEKSPGWIGGPGAEYVPKHDAWQTLLKEVLTEFDGYVQEFELWNEPNDHHHLRVNPGENDVEQFFGLITNHYVTVKDLFPEMRVVVQLTAADYADSTFITDLFKKGAWKYMDGFTFHDYMQLNGSVFDRAESYIKNWLTVAKEEGCEKDLTVYNSEFNANIPDNKATWYTRVNGAVIDRWEGGLQDAAFIARATASYFSINVSKFFFFIWNMEDAGKAIGATGDAGWYKYEKGVGTLRSSTVAYGVSALMLDGKRAVKREKTDGIDIIYFEGKNDASEKVVIAWKMNGSSDHAFDFECADVLDTFGNSIPFSSEGGTTTVTVSPMPVYLVLK